MQIQIYVVDKFPNKNKFFIEKIRLIIFTSIFDAINNDVIPSNWSLALGKLFVLDKYWST